MDTARESGEGQPLETIGTGCGIVAGFLCYGILYSGHYLSVLTIREEHDMITQDIVRKLWDEAGNGNIAVWADDTLTVVPADYSGGTAGIKPLVVLKPIALVNRFELLDYALHDEDLLTSIEATIRAAGGQVTRGPRS
jgi:hypothetical protein